MSSFTGLLRLVETSLAMTNETLNERGKKFTSRLSGFSTKNQSREFYITQIMDKYFSESSHFFAPHCCESHADIRRPHADQRRRYYLRTSASCLRFSAAPRKSEEQRSTGLSNSIYLRSNHRRKLMRNRKRTLRIILRYRLRLILLLYSKFQN